MGGLVIVESPNKCEKIRKILGSGYEVMASVGHIMDLDKKKMGIDLETWTPQYVITPEKIDVVKKIKEAAKKHKDIYIATDADYEGHCIAFNIKEQIPVKGKNIHRVLFKTITKPDVLAGIQNPIPFDQKAYEAQQARRMTDRVVGFKVSPLMWTKGLRNTSAGRVQSAALKFIIDREREIKSFIEEEYWTIVANTKENFDVDFYGINGKKVVPTSKLEVDKIIKKITKELIVTDYQKKSRVREPSAPFITSSLQKEVGTKFGWSSKRVMDTAQSLFSMGQITYHRTDSTRTETNKIEELRDLIEQQHGKKYLSSAPILYSQSASQDAHEAIRPTYEPMPMTLGTDESKLLDLIKAKFMSSQMAPAKFDQVSVKLEHQDADVFEFRASGSVLQFDGFLKVYGSNTKDVNLPALTLNQKIGIKKIIPEQHFTKPPARYTEPTFVDKMEKEGIGRPATYAATIERLLNHKYVIRDGKVLKGTEIGGMVCEYLEKHFSTLTSPSFTATMESEVDDIAQGKLQLVFVLDKFYQDLSKIIEVAQKDKSKDLFKQDVLCKKCNDGSKMIKKVSEFGVFLGCENHPKCGYVLNYNEDGTLSESQTETGLPCPNCGAMIVERKSRFGKFLACSAHPNCKWTGKLDSDGNIKIKEELETLDESCPTCKKGKLVKRPSKFGSGFWVGCDKYPTCKFSRALSEDGKMVEKKPVKSKSKSESTGKKCPKCSDGEILIIEGKFGKFEGCSNFKSGCKYIGKK